MSKENYEILIVEDEPLIAEDISDTLESEGYSIIGIAHNAKDALEIISKHQPSIAILDIKIDGDIDGVELAAIIKEKYSFPFMFLTSYTDKPTLQKIRELKAYGFIVKPFDDNELLLNVSLAIDKYKDESENLASIDKNEKDEESIYIKQKNGLEKVLISDVIYAKAYDNYAELHTTSNNYLIPHTLKSVNEVLGNSFYRVHRSFIINFNQVVNIGSDSIVLSGNNTVPMSRTYKEEILKKVPKIL